MGYDYSKQIYLVKISQQKVDLGEDYTQKVQEHFKRTLYFWYYKGSITYESPCIPETARGK